MILRTERLRLAPLQSLDADALFAILGDAETMRFWETPPLARPSLAHEIVAAQIAAMADGNHLYWTVWRGLEAIGSIDLAAIEFAQGRAEIGFAFRRDCWGFGLAREALSALVGHAFGTLKLERLSARVHADNDRAKTLLGKLGFRPEGRMRGYLERGRQDAELFGLLRTDR